MSNDFSLPAPNNPEFQREEKDALNDQNLGGDMLDIKTRLFEWISVPRAIYELGAHLNFWEEFGDKAFHDPWHNHKEEVITSNPKSDVLYALLNTMIENQV